ncbi:MAG TPA: oligosaccharide flippase family protein [Sedimentisphaerales bacterium]|nr:oligosaccharide flippase family protein [Sedimentisphaerales bacterium]HRS10162.1 oligosaccharide flippase family protein [Sedimentisphaerales bacterium]HRV46868.1 oligosaccharide flippase family protein [Sedimentisphaerales bacterium]
MNPRVQLSKRLFLINSASSVLRRVLYVSILIWLNQYLLRRIGDAEYSLYPLVSGVIFLIPILSVFLTAGLGRFVTEAYAMGDDEKVTTIVSTMTVPLLILATVCLAGGLVFAWHIGHVLTVPPGRLWDARIMLGLLVCCTAMRLPLTPFEFGLYVKQKFVLQNLIGLLVEVVKIALLFALLFGVSTRVLWVVVAEVIAQTLSSAIMVTVSLRCVPAMRFSIGHIDWSIARQIMGFGGWSLVINTASSTQRILDPLFLNKLAALGDLTSYHIATMPARHIQAFVDVATAPLLPQLVTMHATGRHDQMRRLYLRGGRLALWVVLCITLPAIVYCRELITLYLGPEYIETAFVMVLSLLTVTWGFSNWMLPHLCHAKDRMRPIALRFAAMQAVRLGLVLLFVGWQGMGALGLGGAGLIAAAASGAVNLPLSWRLVDVAPGQWFKDVLVKGSIPGVAALLVWVGLELQGPPATWTALGLYVGAGLLVYLVVLVFYSFDAYDRAQVQTIISRIARGLRTCQPRSSPFSVVSSGADVDRR